MTAAEFDIGSEIRCADGDCGELRRIVVDPVARTVTHLVVELAGGDPTPRLVPVELTEHAPDGLRLRCTTAQFQNLQQAEEARFLPGARGDWAYEQEQMLSWPLYGLGGGAFGMGLATPDGPAPAPRPVTRERVPVGEVQIRPGDRVLAADGPIGRVKGLVVDPNDHQVTHVLLEEGHLWGRKRVALPIGSVETLEPPEGGVAVRMTKDEVRDLPAVEVEGLE